MQARPYDSKDGNRIWLSREEQRQLLDAVDEEPAKRIAFELGLNGLRTDEIVHASREHVRPLGDEYSSLIVPDGKTGRREVPIRSDFASLIRTYANARGLRRDEPLIDVSKRSIRNWIDDSRDVLECDDLGMHDLRRSWATDCYYSLAFSGVPIAEQLTMSWGGWAQTSAGRQTFRQNYLGPVPDHVAAQAADLLFE